METGSWSSPPGSSHILRKRCRQVFECDVGSWQPTACDYEFPISYQSNVCAPVWTDTYKKIRANYFVQYRNLDECSLSLDTPEEVARGLDARRRQAGSCTRQGATGAAATHRWHGANSSYGASIGREVRPWFCAEESSTPCDYFNPGFKDVKFTDERSYISDSPSKRSSEVFYDRQPQHEGWDRRLPINVPFSSHDYRHMSSYTNANRLDALRCAGDGVEVTSGSWRDTCFVALLAQQPMRRRAAASSPACLPVEHSGSSSSSYHHQSPCHFSEVCSPWNPWCTAPPEVQVEDNCLRQLEKWSSALRVYSPEGIALAMHLWRRIESRALACRSFSPIAYLSAALWVSLKVLSGRRTIPPAAHLERTVGLPRSTLKRMELIIMGWLDWDPLLDFFPS